MNLQTSNVLATGTSEGAEKGWDQRGRGRKAEEQKEHKLGKFLQDSAKVFGENNLWAMLAKYGHPGDTFGFTSEEQKHLRALKGTVGNCRIGFCVMNAQRLASYNRDPDVKYVEGLVTVHGIPIDHAWIEYKGRVYDPTLMNEKGKTKNGKEKGEYFGVEVPKSEIIKNQFKTGYYQFMSHQRHDKELLGKIWK